MSLEADIDRLVQVPFFSTLVPGALRLLAFAAEARVYANGQFLFRRGEAAGGAYLIVSGTVDLMASDTSDDNRRIIGPGTLIGRHALLVETLRPVSARAGTPTSTLSITRTMFLRVLREYPACAERLRQDWARGLQERLVAD